MSEEDKRSSAQERLKQNSRRVHIASFAAALVVHILVFLLWPTMTVDLPNYDPRPAVPLKSISVVKLKTPEQIPQEVIVQEPELVAEKPVDPLPDTELEIPTIPEVDFRKFEPRKIEIPPIQPAQPLVPIVRQYTLSIPPRIKNSERVRRRLQALYPTTLQRRKIGGIVILKMYIGSSGEVLEAEIEASSGVPLLDRVALQVVEFIEFQPAVSGRRNVPAWVSFPIHFVVED